MNIQNTHTIRRELKNMLTGFMIDTHYSFMIDATGKVISNYDAYHEVLEKIAEAKQSEDPDGSNGFEFSYSPEDILRFCYYGSNEKLKTCTGFFLTDKCVENILELSTSHMKGFSKREVYKMNPFFQNIQIQRANFKNLRVRYFPLMRGMIIPYKPSTICKYLSVPNYAVVMDDMLFPSMYHCGDTNTGYHLSPPIIEANKNAIKKAKGNVMVFGLDFCYYPYMIGRKENVQSITVIEGDEEILGYVKKYILPQMGTKIRNKIRLIHAIPYEYLKSARKEDMEQFDFLYINDHDAVDSGNINYLKYKIEIFQYPKLRGNHMFRSEESIIEFLVSYIFRKTMKDVFMEEFELEDEREHFLPSISIDDFKKVNSLESQVHSSGFIGQDFKRFSSFLKGKLEEYPFRRASDIERFYSMDNQKKLIGQFVKESVLGYQHMERRSNDIENGRKNKQNINLGSSLPSASSLHLTDRRNKNLSKKTQLGFGSIGFKRLS